MALYREAIRQFPAKPAVKEVEIDGSTRFKATSRDMIISPLSADASLHIESIFEGQKEDAEISVIKQGEYTQINGLILGSTLYVNTDDKFYIKFS